MWSPHSPRHGRGMGHARSNVCPRALFVLSSNCPPSPPQLFFLPSLARLSPSACNQRPDYGRKNSRFSFRCRGIVALPLSARQRTAQPHATSSEHPLQRPCRRPSDTAISRRSLCNFNFFFISTVLCTDKRTRKYIDSYALQAVMKTDQ